tara:strand:- start:508 stop:609 length:102 start_codon:yes stop_codon:yes gene_type:complete
LYPPTEGDYPMMVKGDDDQEDDDKQDEDKEDED